MNTLREFSATSGAAPARVQVAIGVITRTNHERADLAVGAEAGVIEVLTTRRRPGTAFAGYWEFPGGKAHPGESLVDCLRRELSEEIGVLVGDAEPIAPVEHVYPHAAVILHPYICRLAPGSPEPRNIEVCEHRWASAGDLRAEDFPPGNAAIIAALRERFTAANPSPAGMSDS